jgi:hypothetical protein
MADSNCDYEEVNSDCDYEEVNSDCDYGEVNSDYEDHEDLDVKSLKILSWDVGIKNLAYCLIEFFSADKFKILAWNIINLVQNESEILTCQGLLVKNNKICGHKATSYVTINNKHIGYCKKHLSSYEIDENLVDNLFNEVGPSITKQGLNYDDWLVCEYVDKKGDLCGKLANYLYDNYEMSFLCKKHYHTIHKKCLNELKSKPIKKLNSSKFPTSKLQLTLVNKLDEMSEIIFSANHVIIENQPSLKNPKMKAIASTLYDYFLIRGLVDKKNNSDNLGINKIIHISPSNKMKLDEKNRKKLEKTSKSKKYKLTKSLSIKYCKKILKNREKELELLLKHSKQDDLCDALLQSFYYVNKKANYF